MLFDTHSHLNDDQFVEDLNDVIERAQTAGVTQVVIPGVDAASAKRAIDIAEMFPGMYAAAGIHPESLANLDEDEFLRVEKLLSHPKVVAVGEIGLDYYWDVAPREFQQDVFARQIQMAAKYNLPIIIHNRDATADTLRVMERECRGKVKGVMHCFTGSWETARQCIDMGFYISFGGPLTFKNANNVREVAEKIPLTSLLIETDAPYLSPHPHRGTRNEPARVELVAQKLAEIKGVDLSELAAVTQANARQLFYKVG